MPTQQTGEQAWILNLIPNFIKKTQDITQLGFWNQFDFDSKLKADAKLKVRSE